MLRKKYCKFIIYNQNITITVPLVISIIYLLDFNWIGLYFTVNTKKSSQAGTLLGTPGTQHLSVDLLLVQSTFYPLE